MNQEMKSTAESQNLKKKLTDYEKELSLLKLKKLELELKEQKQNKGKNDFRYFFEEILQYEKKLSKTAHTDVIDLLNRIKISIEKNEGLEELLLMPRGTWKSTVFTIAGVNWLLTLFPNLRILISNASLGNAEKFLDEIKRNFKKTSYIEVFGDVEGEMWRTTEIRLKTCTRSGKEMSVVIGSPSTSLVSQHFDIQIMDDLVNRESVNTVEQMEKTKQYWKDLIPLGQGVKTIRIGIGTRWSYADLYSWLMEKGVKTILRTIYLDEKREKSFHPEEFSLEAIRKLKEDLGSYDFSMHYLNSPIDDDNATFKETWMRHRFKIEDLARMEDIRTVALFDWALSKTNNADFTGCVVASVDKQNNWYILFAKNYKADITERIELLFEIWKEFKKHNLVIMGVEQKAYEDNVKPLLKLESEKRGVFPAIEQLKDMGRRKEDRIKGLVPRFEYGKIFFREDAKDDTQLLIDQLLRFPKSLHDDLTDALAYLQDIELPEVKKTSKELRVHFGIEEETAGSYGEYGLGTF